MLVLTRRVGESVMVGKKFTLRDVRINRTRAPAQFARINCRAMLILTRRVGETIVIGDDVIVTILGVSGNQVRVGIKAPRAVAVHREEVYERLKPVLQEEGTEAPV